MNVTNVTNSTPYLIDTSVLQAVHVIRLITGVLDAVGIVGNSVSFFVLLLCVGSTSMYKILRALTLADTLFLTCHLLFEVLPAYITMSFAVLDVGYHLVGVTAETATVWLTVLVSIERVVAVCRPLHSQTTFTKRRTLVAICIIWLLSATVRLPGFLQHLFTEQDKDKDKQKRSSLTSTLQSLQGALWWLQAGTSILIVTMCNVTIAVKLHVSIKRWSQLTACSRQESKNTRIPLWIVFTFLLSQVPIKTFVVLTKYRMVKPTTAMLLGALGNALLILNSSTNVIVYFACSRQIRRRFSMALLRKRDSTFTTQPFSHNRRIVSEDAPLSMTLLNYSHMANTDMQRVEHVNATKECIPDDQ